MGKRLQAIRRSDSGFTLTELLVVIVILGVLTGIVVFAVGQFSGQGDVAACKAAMKTTEVAVESYRANNNKVPDDIPVLKTDGYLRSLPSTGKYAISYDKDGADNIPGTGDDGAVSGALIPGGGAC